MALSLSFSLTLLSLTPYSLVLFLPVGVWYTKCLMIARAMRRHNRRRRRRQQPSAKCPCFPKWFFWQCFGRAPAESALYSQIKVFNNNAAWQHDKGISIIISVLFIHRVKCHAGSPHLDRPDNKFSRAHLCILAIWMLTAI